MIEKIAIITDSNSGITNKLANEIDVFVLPMPFIVNGNSYFENINFTQKEFYDAMKNNAEISTSQPSPSDVIDLWDKLLKEYDTIIHIPMSSALSSSYNTARVLSNDYNNRVFIVDNRRISITQKQSVLDAVKLKKQGFSANEIKNKLEEFAYQASIYLAVNDLKYLKKGGRITSTAATIGSVLNIKPILQIQGDKIDAFSKARGMKIAEKKLIEAVNIDLENRFKNLDNINIAVAYSGDDIIGKNWLQKVKHAFPNYDIDCDILSLSISCHTGEGALGIGIYRSI